MVSRECPKKGSVELQKKKSWSPLSRSKLANDHRLIFTASNGAPLFTGMWLRNNCVSIVCVFLSHLHHHLSSSTRSLRDVKTLMQSKFAREEPYVNDERWFINGNTQPPTAFFKRPLSLPIACAFLYWIETKTSTGNYVSFAVIWIWSQCLPQLCQAVILNL